MKVSIIGSGQVGSRVGKKLASVGHEVIFYDMADKPLADLRAAGHHCTTNIDVAVATSEISIVAVPTPLGPDKRFDLSFVVAVGHALGNAIRKKGAWHVVVLKSTVTPGSTRNVFVPAIAAAGLHEGRDFGTVYNPEFLTVISGTWTTDTKFEITPDKEGRVVIGSSDDRSADMLERLYRSLGLPVYKTNIETAEATKMLANSRLPLVVSFINELTELLKEANSRGGLEIDIGTAVKLVHADPRIGPYGSVYGKAYGGPCFKKDPNAFATWLADTAGKKSKLIESTIEVNGAMAERYGVRE
jgi:UDPglucose 6-dehydrogenase